MKFSISYIACFLAITHDAVFASPVMVEARRGPALSERADNCNAPATRTFFTLTRCFLQRLPLATRAAAVVFSEAEAMQAAQTFLAQVQQAPDFSPYQQTTTQAQYLNGPVSIRFGITTSHPHINFPAIMAQIGIQGVTEALYNAVKDTMDRYSDGGTYNLMDLNGQIIATIFIGLW